MSRATELALNHGRLYHTLSTAYWGFSSAQLEAFYHAARSEALREAAAECENFGGFKDGYECASELRAMAEREGK